MDDLSKLNAAIAAFGQKLVGLAPQGWESIHSETGFTYEPGVEGGSYKVIAKTAGEERSLVDIKNIGEVKPLAFAIRDSLNSAGKGRVKTFIMDIDAKGKFDTHIHYWDPTA